MTALALIQSRMGSTRLPGKVLADLSGRTVLEWVVRAAHAVPGVDKVAVATSDQPQDDMIADWCRAHDVTCHRGPETDVLARFTLAARAEDARTVMRLTADCPFLDPHVCGQVLALLHRSGADYASNVDPPTWPDGLDCEAFTREALLAAYEKASLASDREHVTAYIRAHRREFQTTNLTCPIPGLTGDRWTLDTEADLTFLRALASKLQDGRPPSYMEVLAALDSGVVGKEARPQPSRTAVHTRSLAVERSGLRPRSYHASEEMRERAERTIPLAAQTFSKCHQQFPAGAAPLFLTHGRGGRVWDVDGNGYVDLICGLMPVVLGYCDPDVDEAIRAQLGRGISFSLATELEAALAERLVEIIPCAEMVRFGKNGTDATSAAVRVARAATGRDRVVVCGYHGWQDWYIGATTRHKGVPGAVRELTHTVPYNDLTALHGLLGRYSNDIAAVIMEPVAVAEPTPGYLEAVRDLTHRHGAVLIFDEVITGFRLHLGGAQALFGVTPDLASFGKAMGNGMPISAVVGRADLMAQMEEIFFSSTFGGETLSLAAAIAVIDKMRREPVIDTLWSAGARLADGLRSRLRSAGLEEVIRPCGLPPWTILTFHDHSKARKEAIKTLLLREMLSAGVLLSASHNVCYAHTEDDLLQVLGAYDHALSVLADELEGGRLEERLGAKVIEPVFKVR